MLDIERKPFPRGFGHSPALFAEVGDLLLEVFTDDGVPTWEVFEKTGEGGKLSPRALPTPSRQPERRRVSKGSSIERTIKGMELLANRTGR